MEQLLNQLFGSDGTRNDKIKSLLEGLYVNQVVKHKYRLTPEENSSISLKDIRYAEQLDILGVGWVIQNTVAHAGSEQSNWERYNHTVLHEVFSKLADNNII